MMGPDAEASAIFRATCRAAARGASVLIIEDVLPDEHADPQPRTPGGTKADGHRRSPSQFAELVQRADFGLTAVIDTAGPMRIIEGVAV